MLYNFSTDNLDRANAALLIYALYKSRDSSSPMTGVDTWSRVESACVGACKKSSTTSEFVTQFKRIAHVGSIKPRYLATHERGLIRMDDGSLIADDGVKEYQIPILEDDRVRRTIERDYPLIVMLVRERIQRERYELTEDEEDEDEDI